MPIEADQSPNESLGLGLQNPPIHELKGMQRDEYGSLARVKLYIKPYGSGVWKFCFLCLFGAYDTSTKRIQGN